MRLQKYLARSGVASRRASEHLIAKGQVSVNEKIVTEMGVCVNEDADTVKVDGKVVSLINETRTFILNKPLGYVTTMDDPQGRPTVAEFVQKAGLAGGFPVGRLDIETSGLLILTNDGDLGQTLSHPSHGVKKTYVAKLDKPLKDNDARKLERGVDIGDFVTSPAKVERQEDKSICSITIHEGKNRQVRRMFKALGYKVQELKRVSYGSLKLGDLNEGEFRELKAGEIQGLLDRAF